MRLANVFTALACLAVLFGVGTPALSAAEPITFKPESPWQMDYADDSCALRRLFSDGEARVVLDLRKFAPHSTMLAMVMADGLESGQRPVKYRFGPAPEWRDAGTAVHMRMSEEFDGFVFSTNIVPEDEKREESDGRIDPEDTVRMTRAFDGTSSVSVAGAFTNSITLDTGSLKAPYEAMQACLHELTMHWGIDVEAHKSLTRVAVPKDINVIIRRLQRDYPLTMVEKGISAVVNIRLGVDENGAVSDCHVQLDIAATDFKREACENFARAKFYPALDKDGKAIASYWTKTVIYGFF